MSNKRYRTPAKTDPVRPAIAGPQPAPMSASDAALIEAVKRFLGKALEKVGHALDQLDSTPIDANEYNPRRMEWRNSQIAILARLGIGASKALMQALKLTGGASKEVANMLKDAVISLEERLKGQARLAAAD